MFETLSYFTLQQYWWILVAILGATLVFMMFVQGGQVVFQRMGETEKEEDLILNSTGKHYKLTFSVLVTFGGAVFASFPVFYATSFGGAYLVWMAILFMFIIQAVAYEYRKKENNFLGKNTYNWFLVLNGFFGPLLLGVAVATFFTGSNFIVETSNLVNSGASHHIITSWTNSFYGLEALWNTNQGAFITNISLGLAIAFLVQILSILYVIHHVDDKKIIEKAKFCLIPASIFFLIPFLVFVFKLLTITGFAYDPETLKIYMEDYKYLKNLLDSGIIFSLFVGGTVFVLLGIGLGFFKSRNAFWFGGLGTFFVVLSVFLLAGLNYTSFYPSLSDLQSSLTIENASSSNYTLIAMSYVSILLPFVIAYIVWAWSIIAGKPMKKTDLEKELETY